MERLRIALDVEGVLANSHAATAEKSDVLDERHTPPQNYDFDGQDLIDEYMHVSHNVWYNHNHTIPPMEDGLREATQQLQHHHDVDIVTSRTGVDRKVREWLEGYNVAYDDLIITDHPRSNKTEYGDHDVHIEDSPEVTADALEMGRAVFLVDRPYNEGIDYDRVWRVSGVTEAAEMLTDPSVVTEVRTL
jgi:uncharacterized HAD superfamily protein